MIEHMTTSTCYACQKTIYHVPASKGVASEWRHNSSAHPISWSPEKHIAGPNEVFEHQHRWTTKPKRDTIRRCEVYGCDATIIEAKPDAAGAVKRTEREQREHESRLRGASARGNRPPRKAVSNPS